MKKCSYCGSENDDVATICQGCGEEFEALAVADPDSEANLRDPALSPVIVGTFSSLPEAQLLADRLEAAGIETEIPEEFAPQVFSAVIPLEAVTVRVAAKDREAAKEIVEAASPENPPVTAQPQPGVRPEEAEAGTSMEQAEKPVIQKTCVSCGVAIPDTARLCPNCGWTQPDAD